MTEEDEALNRRLARKIARQLEMAGWHDAAEYVESDFMAVLINFVLREHEQRFAGRRPDAQPDK